MIEENKYTRALDSVYDKLCKVEKLQLKMERDSPPSSPPTRDEIDIASLLMSAINACKYDKQPEFDMKFGDEKENFTLHHCYFDKRSFDALLTFKGERIIVMHDHWHENTVWDVKSLSNEWDFVTRKAYKYNLECVIRRGECEISVLRTYDDDITFKLNGEIVYEKNGELPKVETDAKDTNG